MRNDTATATTTITIKGTPIAVAIRPRDGSGPPLLLINGIGANLEVFDPFLDALDTHHDAVAVNRFVQMKTGDVDVSAVGLERPVRRHEAVAGRMRLEPADVEVHLLGQAEPLAADLHEIAGGDQRFDVTFERGALLARDLEDLQQLAHAGGMMNPLAHQLEDLIG